MMKPYVALLFCLLAAGNSFAQSTTLARVRDYRISHETEIYNEFFSFLSIPNIAADTVNLMKNAEFIAEMMRGRGIQKIQLLHPVTAGAAPAVYGEVIIPGATQTLTFYAHYDGQPVNPAQWHKSLTPFHPQLLSGNLNAGGLPIDRTDATRLNPEWRLYGRGTSDDKAGVMSILCGYDAIKAAGLTAAFNLKFFFEGEEEAGSPHLAEILTKYNALLQSDLWIICDGPVHQSGRKQVVFGVRGDTHLDLTVYASKRPLHSGHYGNWAPNPAMMLVKLLSSMKDDNGHVLIRGFYDDVMPLSPTEKKALKAVPVADAGLKEELGIKEPEQSGLSLVEAIHLPSLNINGIQSGNVGKLASNQIPTTATAVLDLRLVPGNDVQRQQDKVIDHIRKQGYYVIDREPTDAERRQYAKIIKVVKGNDGYNAQRTPLDLPIAQMVIRAVKSTSENEIVLMPTMGGSLPLYLFEKHLAAKTITVPVANYDNNQHAENENIRLQNLWAGIEIMAAIMLMK
jgi:acetylornithine deacetylase/succinyl-diaminopimelate desuccinylase-like protein